MSVYCPILVSQSRQNSRCGSTSYGLSCSKRTRLDIDTLVTVFLDLVIVENLASYPVIHFALVTVECHALYHMELRVTMCF
jgi:hypothetical protein